MDGRKRNNIAYIGIGSNLGDKVKNCREAIERIAVAEEIELTGRSTLYRTEPWGNEDQDWFVNTAIAVKTSFVAEELLAYLRKVEGQLLKKKEGRWGPRNIDLDILFFNNEILETPSLTVPHPFLHLRRFVLIPLQEICPDFVHPQLGLTITELLERSGDEKRVVAL